MNSGSIARRYARAIFELAAEENRYDDVGRELAAASAALEADPDVLAIVRNPTTTLEEKRGIAQALVSALKLSPVAANAVRLLAERGRLGDLSMIERIFRDLADQRAGRLRAHLRSAVALSDEVANRIAGGLGKATSRNVVVERSVDPSIMGGVVAQVGSLVFDGSLKSQFDRLERELKS